MAGLKAKEPLSRYLNDVKAFREAMRETNAIVVGPWLLSALFTDEEIPHQSLKALGGLQILVHQDVDWRPLFSAVEKEGYELMASPLEGGSILFGRQGGDDLILKICKEEELKQKEVYSLEAYAVSTCLSTLDACFMTWKQAVYVCPKLTRQRQTIPLMPLVDHQTSAEDEAKLLEITIQSLERLRKSPFGITAQHTTEVLATRHFGDEHCFMGVLYDSSTGEQSDQLDTKWSFSFKDRLPSPHN